MKYGKKIMKIKQNSGNEKILLLLQDYGKSISVKPLAEKIGIAYKNIHRNITQLLNADYIRVETVQDGRKRLKYIHLTSKGKDFNPNQETDKEQFENYDANYEQYDNTHLVQDIKPDTIRLGIGFYRDYARGLGIPNYSSLRLPMLKLKIGLVLIKQSGLVDTMTKINKYFGVEY